METKLREKGSLELAYLGDAVYELQVRFMLSEKGNKKAGHLHKEALRYVSARGQSAAAKAVEPVMTPEEVAVFHRGRNSHPKSVSKNVDPGEYALATGLEALFGYLYLAGQQARIKELFALCRDAVDAGDLK